MATWLHRYFIQLCPLAIPFDNELVIVNHCVVSTRIQGVLNRFAGLGHAHVLWMPTHRDDIDEFQSGLEQDVVTALPQGTSLRPPVGNPRERRLTFLSGGRVPSVITSATPKSDRSAVLLKCAGLNGQHPSDAVRFAPRTRGIHRHSSPLLGIKGDS